MYTNIDYAHLREVLCVERNEEGLKKRQKMFSDFDPNGNGFLSLAEVDKGIRDVLRLPEIFAFFKDCSQMEIIPNHTFLHGVIQDLKNRKECLLNILTFLKDRSQSYN